MKSGALEKGRTADCGALARVAHRVHRGRGNTSRLNNERGNCGQPSRRDRVSPASMQKQALSAGNRSKTCSGRKQDGFHDGKIDRLADSGRLMEFREPFTTDTPEAERPSRRHIPSLRGRAL